MSEIQRRADRVATEAAEWLARLSNDDVSAEDRADFQAWIAASPDHRREYDEAQAMWANLDVLSGLSSTEPDALPCELRLEIDRAARLVEGDLRRQVSTTGARWWAAAAAAVVLGLVGLAGMVDRGPRSIEGVSPAAAEYKTQIGERREILLADGSLVWLNTDTEAHVALTSSQRTVHLSSGEAYFTVAKDPDRPFVVTAGEGTVRAVGTEFNVYHRLSQTTVTVVEGMVDVIRPAPEVVAAYDPVEPAQAKKTRRVHQSQAVTLNEAETVVIDLDPEAAARTASWRRGRLYFDAVTLGEMISEIDHYVPERIVVADDSIAGLVGGGVVHVDNVESILKALEMTWPIHVAYESSDVIVLSRKR